MVAAANPRSRLVAVSGGGTGSRSKAMLVLIAIPLVMAAALAWQVASTVFHTEVVVRQAVSVGQVTLEAEPTGTRLDLVMVDRIGKETTFTGNFDVSLRDPDGAVWQTSRSVAASDFQPLPDSSLMAGRNGYTLLVPSRDWARPPRRGGLATVSITATPNDDGPQVTSQTQQRFP
jgi:hypothetical protein